MMHLVYVQLNVRVKIRHVGIIYRYTCVPCIHTLCIKLRFTITRSGCLHMIVRSSLNHVHG